MCRGPVLRKMKIKFYTLLYIDLEETRLLGGSTRKGEDRIALFLRNAALLDRSLRTNNEWCGPLTVLTNDAPLLERISSEIGHRFDIRTIDFTLGVPKGIKFYSAHYKIDAFRYLSGRPEDEYSVLLDNDIVSLRPFTREFLEIADRGVATCFHLSMSDTGRMMADCRKIVPGLAPVQWTGGEFWGGTREFFGRLYNESVKVAGAYFPQVGNDLFHVGDEMITSIAFGRMREEGLRYYDVRLLDILRRYWVLHEKEPLDRMNPVLAHLPADKLWIARRSLTKDFSAPAFLRAYRRHWRLYKAVALLKKLLNRK